MSDIILDPQHPFVHHRPPLSNMEAVHKNYGLWIFAGGSGTTSENGYANENWRYFEFYAISHLVEGHGRYSIHGGVECDMVPGDCVIVTPGTLQRYGGYLQKYHEDTINFCGPVADMLKRSGILMDGLVHAGKVRRVKKIWDLVLDPTLESQIRANIELQNFLVDLHLEKRLNRAEYPLFDLLLKEITSHIEKWWTVREMAEMCNLSDDQLRRVFLKYTGGTPKQYLDRLKLKRAGELLASGKMTIQETAAALGYVDQYHFSRRFKAIMGMPPGKYRDSIFYENR